MAVITRQEITDKAAFEAILEGRDMGRRTSWREPDGYWVETTHKGLVLALGEKNGYDDSDFYALVWDAEKAEPRKVYYATTRAWTESNYAEVDATLEVLAAYDRYLAQQALRRAEEAVRREAATVRHGKRVRVVKGRKVPHGTEGIVHWIGAGFGGRTRVGLTDAAGQAHWIDAQNVEVVLDLGAA